MTLDESVKMSSGPCKTDVVIVGAGFAGLSAAALLSRRGVSAEVFESLPVAGGRARVAERGGFMLDHGIHGHRCGESGPAARLLKELGENMEWVNEEGSRSLIISEGQRLQFPESVSEILRLPFLNFGDRVRMLFLLGKIFAASPEKYARTSYASFVGRSSQRPGFRTLVKALCAATMAPDIELASAGEVIDLLQQALRAERALGVPVGGQRQVLDKIIRHINDPVRLNLGTRMKKIHVRDGRVDVVETTRGPWKPRAALFTIPVQRLFRFVDPGHFRAEFTNYAMSLAPTAGISVDLALAEPVTDIAGGILDLDELFMGKYPSNADPSLAPQGRQLASWLWVVDPTRLKDREFMRGAKEAMRKRIEELVPGTMGAVMWERWLNFTILDGVHLIVGQAWQDRHPLQSEDLKNLFFAGDTAKAPGVGGDIAFGSALSVVPLIERFLAEGR